MLSSAVITLALALSAAATPLRFNRRASNINTMPEELAVTGLKGGIQPYRRAVNTVPEELAVTGLKGGIKPYRRAAAASAVALKNGQNAIAQNAQFAGVKAGDACTASSAATCAGAALARCTNGVVVVERACLGGTVCAALPNVDSAGTSVSCTTAASRDSLIAATGATAAAAGGATPSTVNSTVGASTDNGIITLPENTTTVAAAAGATPPAANSTVGASTANSTITPPDNTTTTATPPTENNAGGGAVTGAGGAADATALQTSLTLDPSVIQTGFEADGQETPTAGQVASLTSSNNFINFCALTLPATPLTNGKQITTGSCNGAPIGLIPASTKMPSAKFVSPKNLDTITANANFTVQLALKNLEAGNFVNAAANYFAAPQQLNAQGIIVGHTHVVIENIASLTDTTPLDPLKFTFFKGVNAAADANGQVSVLVAGKTGNGVPAGAYRMCSINTAANHQPAIVPIAQHGMLDDCIYFTAA